MKKLTGLIAAPFTPLTTDGELALDQIDQLAALYAKNGVQGAFICGTTGEGASLSRSEKALVMERWGEVKGEIETVFMLGGTSLTEMQGLATLAEKSKMDGTAILCPYFLRPQNVQDLVDYCAAIAKSAPSLPFYYYHIPALTGGHFSMLEFLQLADEVIPNLAGIKYTHANIMEYHACRRFKDGQYSILWGTDEALLSGLVIGVEGAVGSTYNYAAPLYNELMAAFAAGNLEKAEALQFKSVQMVQLLQKYGGIAAGKAFMKIIGVDCGWFRPPVHSLTESVVAALKAELSEMGFFDFCSKI
ncbi:MAG: dihydrodipicolinate synthase family protein [Saprospiraceae bacterium]|nr:dihydrodipicolinate synthase family protein [Saprospiraceae bacterium]